MFVLELALFIEALIGCFFPAILHEISLIDFFLYCWVRLGTLFLKKLFCAKLNLQILN